VASMGTRKNGRTALRLSTRISATSACRSAFFASGAPEAIVPTNLCQLPARDGRRFRIQHFVFEFDPSGSEFAGLGTEIPHSLSAHGLRQRASLERQQVPLDRSLRLRQFTVHDREFYDPHDPPEANDANPTSHFPGSE